MSAHAVDTHHHDDHGHGDDAPHSTFKGYATGFILSVILTAIPFWLVMNKTLPSPGLTATVILGLAAVQIARALAAGKVIGTVGSDDKLDLVREHGADVALNYNRENFVDVVKRETAGREECQRE